MEFKLPKLKFGLSSPKQVPTSALHCSSSPRQVSSTSQHKGLDSIRLPKLDAVNIGTHKSSIALRKIFRASKDDEQTKFENLIECLKDIDNIVV